MGDSAGDLDVLVQRGYRFAFSLTHDAAKAEDLVQDAWLAVLKVKGPWTHGYLFSTIRNRFIDQYRREKLEPGELPEDAQNDAIADERSIWRDDEDTFFRNGELESALGRLKPEERAALYLAAVEDYSARQIAELLGRPRGTVLSMIHRARHKLRRGRQSKSETRP